jgi:hypothetical protein
MRSSTGHTSARTSASALSPSSDGSDVPSLAPPRRWTDGGEQQLGRQLEVDSALRQHAVPNSKVRVPGQHVGQDALDLHARGFT